MLFSVGQKHTTVGYTVVQPPDATVQDNIISIHSVLLVRCCWYRSKLPVSDSW